MRQALGGAVPDPAFLQTLFAVLNLPQPWSQDNWWWGMDYHLDWLQDSLAKFRGIPPISRKPGDLRSTDVDLLLANHDHVIAIEAKGESSWSTHQLRQKLDRLQKIFPSEGVFSNAAKSQDVKVFFVLMSPSKPKRLDKVDVHLAWATNDQSHYWMKLDLIPRKRSKKI